MINTRKLKLEDMKKIKKENAELLSKIVYKIDIEQKTIYLLEQIKQLFLEDKKIEELVLTEIGTLESEIKEREKQPEQLELKFAA